jgi:hypothetical protein
VYIFTRFTTKVCVLQISTYVHLFVSRFGGLKWKVNIEKKKSFMVHVRPRKKCKLWETSNSITLKGFKKGMDIVYVYV